MLVLFETPAGYAVFKLLDEKKLEKSDNLYLDFQTPEKASKILKLKGFKKFTDTTEALAAATAAWEGKVSKPLRKFLKKVVSESQEQLLVADAKLGSSIKDKCDLNCVTNSAVQELMRCIRSQIDGLVGDLPQREMAAMALGLAHSLGRYKLKFSPDKVDTMIVQAVSLLDDLDKELNNYMMRCREWYGWHFPELSKIIQDNIAYIKTIQLMGFRTNASSTDFSSILPEDLEAQLKETAEISMGTEISDDDMENIRFLADQVIEISDYRTQLYEYLKNRMMAIAPNVTVLVGELVGARLISHAGTLMNLAKHPASTIQILGAEKALFRALKTKKDTPKYGLIYHATLVGQASAKIKGKASRMLAAKTALAARFDALGEDSQLALGVEHRAYLEKRIRELEEGGNRRISAGNKKTPGFNKYENKSEIRQYNAGADTAFGGKRKFENGDENGDVSFNGTANKKPKIEPIDADEEPMEETPKKKKKKKKQEDDDSQEDVSVHVENVKEEEPQKKKKKRKSESEQAAEEPMEDVVEATPEKKKKKKKNKE